MGCGEETCRHCLARHPIVGNLLTDDEIADIHRNRRRLSLPTNTTIFGRGKRPPYLANLVAGAIKLTRIDGADSLDALLIAPDFIGPLEGVEARAFSAVALSKCELCCFEPASLARVFARHPRLQARFLRHFMDALVRLRSESSLLRRPQATAKLAALLWIIAKRSPPGAEIELPLKGVEIAELLGLAPETVSRSMSILRADEIIHPLGRRRFSVPDPDRLRQFAEE